MKKISHLILHRMKDGKMILKRRLKSYLTGVGCKGFVEATKERLGIRAKGRKVFSKNGAYELREPAAPYRYRCQTLNCELF